MTEINTHWVQTATLNPPTLQDNTADADRLILALKASLKTAAIDIDLDLLKRLPDILRQNNYQVRCIVFKDRQKWLLTGIFDANDATPIAGLAVDLGTTRVVLRLVDLVTSRTLAEIDRIRDRITYLELNVNQEFMNRFSAAKFLPNTNHSLFPSVKVLRRR